VPSLEVRSPWGGSLEKESEHKRNPQKKEKIEGPRGMLLKKESLLTLKNGRRRKRNDVVSNIGEKEATRWLWLGCSGLKKGSQIVKEEGRKRRSTGKGRSGLRADPSFGGKD